MSGPRHRVVDAKKCPSIFAVMAPYLRQQLASIKQHKQLPAALVFDIDDTAIINDLVDDEDASVINPQIKQIYDYAKQIGYVVIFVTARPYSSSNHRFTVDELRRHQYTGYHSLTLMPDDEDLDVGVFKTQTRAALSKQFTIVGSFGDQPTDVENGYFRLGVLLPVKRR